MEPFAVPDLAAASSEAAETLRREGFLLVRQSRADALAAEVVAFCERQLGGLESTPLREVAEVRYDPQASASIAASSAALPPHTDGTFLRHPPAIITLLC